MVAILDRMQTEQQRQAEEQGRQAEEQRRLADAQAVAQAQIQLRQDQLQAQLISFQNTTFQFMEQILTSTGAAPFRP